MSHFSAPRQIDLAPLRERVDVSRWQGRALVVGLLAAAASGLGAWLALDQFFRSYLVGWLLWFGVAAGCLALLMIQHLSGGAWGLVARRVLEAAARTLPALLVLAVPLFFALPRLYLWARPAAVAADHLLAHKAPYLNAPFFIARVVLTIVVFSALAWALSGWSRRQDESGEAALGAKMRAASGLGLVLFVLLGTFTAIDWLMSLDPHWYSSLYGPIVFTGQGLSGLVFVIVVVRLLARATPLGTVVTPKHFHDYGKLLLAFVMFWTYLSISQLIIVWQANLPEEVVWFDHRLHGGWQIVASALLLLHFLFPFLLLLSRSLKKKMGALAAVAAWLFVMRWLDLHWQAAPTWSPGRLSFHWLDLVVPVALGGLWLALFFRQLGQAPLLPQNDPHLAEAIAHE